MNKPILELRKISKKLKGRDILKNVNLSIYPSEIYGFLGPNSADKTTTIRIITDLIKPNSGSVTICKHSLKSAFSKAMINIDCIIESPDLYKFLARLENLELFTTMKNNATKQRIDKIIELVSMKHQINNKIGTYSLEMHQRLRIAQTILNKPRLLLLDEPTNGLDPTKIAEFRQLIRKLTYEEGITVFISSHILTEVQQMCDTMAIIRQGEIIKTLKVEKIQTDNIVKWQISNIAKATEILKKKWNIEGKQSKKNSITASIGKVSIGEINSTFINEGLALSYCTTLDSSLKNLFLNLTKDNKIV